MGGLQNSCSKSTYNPDTGRSLQTACLQCPANSVTNDTAATSPRHCTCTAGYYNMRLTNETVECFKCPMGSSCATEGVTLATLPLITGYYRSSNISSDLRRCPDFGENSGCVGGVSDGEGPCKLGLEARAASMENACYCIQDRPSLCCSSLTARILCLHTYSARPCIIMQHSLPHRDPTALSARSKKRLTFIARTLRRV